MLKNLKFCKFDEKDAKFGFRLVGGSDFEAPLTVIKVEEESLAEKFGLLVEDVIVRINETPTANLTHTDAHVLLKQSGNNFMLGILRPDNINNKNNIDINDEQSLSQTPIMSPSQFSERNFETSPKPTINELNEINELNNCYNEQENVINTMKEAINQNENHIPDELIAEMMSGEAEVLKDHNILGVNFNKIMPQSVVFKNSQVFKQLNAEAIKTKEEMDKDTKKWSTFLQKPNRPIPHQRSFLEEAIINEGAYKVQIVKQPKPRVAPGRTPTPPLEVEITPEPEVINVDLIDEEKTLDQLIEKVVGHSENSDQEDVELGDDEVPDLHPLNDEFYNVNCTEYQNDDIENNHCADFENLEDFEEESPADINEKSKEELFLERQLADVQNQLLALCNLPLTIQKTLDAVTAKLSELVPAIQSQVRKRYNNEPEHQGIISNDSELQVTSVESETIKNEDIIEIENTHIENLEHCDFEDNQREITGQTFEMTQEEKNNQIDEQSKLKENDWEYKKHQEEVEMEHQQRLIRNNSSKRPANRAFFPLTPNSDRGISLPGGRKWRNAKDAYNEEFITEVLTSQAELIIGTTVGVNFLKYQKPEKKVNIENSEVYRLVHNMEHPPKHGIEVRSEKCVAAQDIRVV